jgi:hypothetical protein
MDFSLSNGLDAGELVTYDFSFKLGAYDIPIGYKESSRKIILNQINFIFIYKRFCHYYFRNPYNFL